MMDPHARAFLRYRWGQEPPIDPDGVARIFALYTSPKPLDVRWSRLGNTVFHHTRVEYIGQRVVEVEPDGTHRVLVTMLWGETVVQAEARVPEMVWEFAGSA